MCFANNFFWSKSESNQTKINMYKFREYLSMRKRLIQKLQVFIEITEDQSFYFSSLLLDKNWTKTVEQTMCLISNLFFVFIKSKNIHF
jgi:hypothetical protein